MFSEQGENISFYILAGGRGTRLRSSERRELQTNTKLMVSVERIESQPMIAYTLEGISAVVRKQRDSIVLLTAEHPESDPTSVESYSHEYLKDKGINYGIIREPKLLGTAGAIFNAMTIRNSGDVVIVCPGDVLYPYSNLSNLAKYHQNGTTPLTWAVTSVPGEGAQNAGKLWVNHTSNHLAATYEACPEDAPEVLPNYIVSKTSVGVVAINPDFYLETFPLFRAEISTPTPDLYRLYMPWALANGYIINTFDILSPAPDLGTPERFEKFARIPTYV